MYESQQKYFGNGGADNGEGMHTSILNKTNYNKVKPDLKRHYPEMWGRFLDNHYDPQKH